MSEIAFYHLQQWPLEKALPKLLERAMQTGKRALVLTSTEAQAEALNTSLWAYEPGSWLPHGSKKDGRPEDQPIWISDTPENTNSAAFLFLTDGVEVEDLGAFDRCFELFDGHNMSAVEAARGRWKAYKDAGHTLTYWQQGETGGWEKKASTADD